MKTYQFEGYSDDTFAEISTDNCANGTPIQFEIKMPDGAGIRVTGCYGLRASGCILGDACWMIGVESLDEDNPADWEIRHKPSFSGLLIVEVPDEALLTLLNKG